MSRDTQFAGWAKAVVERVTGLDEWDTDDLECILARAAYDLVKHTVAQSYEPVHVDEVTDSVPDMPMLPRDL